MMPCNIMDSLNTWHCRKATKDEWCSGFWPGVLWYDYEYTGKATIKEEAEKFTETVEVPVTNSGHTTMIWVFPGLFTAMDIG